MNDSGIRLAASVVLFQSELQGCGMRIDDVMRACVDSGVGALEVRDEPFLGLPGPGPSLAGAGLAVECDRLRELAHRHGLALLVASGAVLGVGADRERLLHSVRAAAAVGSPVVRVFPPADAGGTVAWVREVLDATSCGAGVDLCLENTSDPRCSTSRVIELVRATCLGQGARLRVTLDTGNCRMNPRDVGPVEAVRAARGSLGYVHLKDVEKQGDGDGSLRDCPPGRGMVDFGAVLGALKAQSYEGYACLEFDGRGSGARALEQAVGHVRRFI